MARKTNPTLIGVFVLGAAALAVASVAYFGSGSFGRRTARFVLFFDGSLQGLTVGAPVQFRGVRIGSVVEVLVRYHSDDQHIDTPVFIEIEADRLEWVDDGPQRGQLMPQLIERGLRAQLVTVSFVTGMLAVQLDFHPDKPAELHAADMDILEIPTIPSPFEQIARTLQNLPIEDLMNDLRHAVQGVDELVRSPDLQATILTFQSAAADVSTLVQNVNAQIEPVTSSLTATATKLQSTLDQASERIAAAEKSLSDALLEYKRLAENVNQQVEPLAGDVRAALAEADAALEQSRHTLKEWQLVIARDSELHYRLVSTLADLSAAAQALKALADTLEKQPESIFRGKLGTGGP